MKLLYSTTSPYVRKVMVCAHELGLMDQIELEKIDVWAADSLIRENNPLAKIPCLILAPGNRLYDSPVICEYFDSLSSGLKLFPEVGDARWVALRFQALADGIMDAAVLRMKESMRQESERSDDWMARQKDTMDTSVQELEASVDLLEDETLTIGQVAVACCLSYLDLRYAQENWQASAPKLAKWHAAFLERASMIATTPQE